MTEVRHINAWLDDYRYRFATRMAVLCGATDGLRTCHAPKATCPMCRATLDQLLELNFATVERWNNGLMVRFTREVWPRVYPAPGTLFGIDSSTYELWNGSHVYSWSDESVGRLFASPVTITSVDFANRSITLSGIERLRGHRADRIIIDDPVPPRSRRPSFIPVARLDGRR